MAAAGGTLLKGERALANTEKHPRAEAPVALTPEEYTAAALAAARLREGALLAALTRFRTKKEARQRAAGFSALYPEGRLLFFEDEAVTESGLLCRRDPYARLAAAETPTLFVILREDGSFVPFRKDALIGCGGGDAAAFLQTAFARRLRRVR